MKEIINSKISIIGAEGIIYMMGRVNEQRLHVKYLLDYINSKYPNVNTSNLTIGNARDKIAYQLTSRGNIVYFNDVSFGMFYFPDNLTDEQVNTLNNIDLGNQEIAICYNLKDLGKFINFRTIGLDGDYKFDDVINEYFIKNGSKQRRR